MPFSNKSVQSYMTKLINPAERVVIVYPPKYLGSAAKDIERAGGLVVRNLDDLIALVK